MDDCWTVLAHYNTSDHRSGSALVQAETGAGSGCDDCGNAGDNAGPLDGRLKISERLMGQAADEREHHANAHSCKSDHIAAKPRDVNAPVAVGRSGESAKDACKSHAMVELPLSSFNEPWSEPLLELMAWCVLRR
jgi:hypothetical protein